MYAAEHLLCLLLAVRLIFLLLIANSRSEIRKPFFFPAVMDQAVNDLGSLCQKSMLL